jgi:hypothetical protein
MQLGLRVMGLFQSKLKLVAPEVQKSVEVDTVYR